MKVCIIGDGLTSLTLAKVLVNRDIFVDIICKKNNKKKNQSRTLGISKSNIEYFNKNILNISEISWKINKIKIFSENQKNNELIKFENPNKNLFAIIKNEKLKNKLNLELNKSKLFNYKVNFDYKNLSKFNYDLIINCSFDHELTKKFFSKKLKKNYNSVAYTTIINHKKLSSNDTAIQIFTNKGPLAFLPISENQTSVVYSFRVGNSQNKLDIQNLIQKFNPLYKIQKVNDISKFNLESVNLRKYYKNNILAFGDLLHKLHPLAGQGFNMSIRDIKDLVELIDYRINLGLPLDKSICIEFQNKTKSKNYIFSKGIDLIYESFNFESKIQSNFISSAAKLVGQNKFINKYFKQFADIGLTS